MSIRILPAVLIAAALCLVACGKKEESAKPAPAPAPAPKAQAPAPAVPAGLAVTNVTLGKTLGPDKKVPSATNTFDKGDTIYAAVETSGAGEGKLDAKWTYRQGDKVSVVNESFLKLATMGPAVNVFHVAKPGGWPAGDYQVELALDGKPVGSKSFTVK